MIARLFARRKRTATARQPRDDIVDRRGVLRLGGMAAAGAAGAALMTTVDASPAAAAAGVDGDVALGVDNAGPSTSRTAIIANRQENEVFGVFNDAASGAAIRGRVAGDSGDWGGYRFLPIAVFGETNAGGTAWGIFGDAPNATGVGGQTEIGEGVAGIATSTGTGVSAISSLGPAVLAQTSDPANTNPAVIAFSGAPAQAAVRATGSDTNSFALDVRGRSVTATGAAATAPAAKVTSGTATQAALQAFGLSTGTGLALDVRGKAQYNRSGVLTIPAGADHKLTPVVVGGLTATSAVHATLQTNAGAAALKAAVPITAGANAGRIQIFLTAAAAAGGARVAWLVLG